MLVIIVCIIGGLVVLALLVVLFTRKDYTIKKEVIVSQPADVVYGYLRFFRNHQSFNAWYLKDPNMKVRSKGTDGQVGYVLMYEGNKDLGAGEQELVGLEPNRKIDIELRFLKPFKSRSRTPYELEDLGGNRTKVSWTMHGRMNYPMNLVLLLMDMDVFLGKDVMKSLENLKAILENRS